MYSHGSLWPPYFYKHQRWPLPYRLNAGFQRKPHATSPTLLRYYAQYMMSSRNYYALFHAYNASAGNASKLVALKVLFFIYFLR